ncbi:hypothetical protein B0H12DRAFT_1192332, partial [Mycena haematopus]
MATLAHLPRELAHWTTTTTSAMPMTPPHSDRTRYAHPLPVRYTLPQAQLLTPPDDTPPDSKVKEEEQAEQQEEETKAATEDPPLAWTRDWLHVSRTRPESAALVAEKTCEMICYLWFASSTKAGKENDTGGARPSPLQLTASPTFVSFTQKLLETTQVSQSVIVLALHYIHRLRQRNAGTPAQPGSEFRVAVAGLMMANKFLDDNTYTNATWAAVSLIPLAQINTMEREFLLGCEYNLYVSRRVYEDWGRLLRGLVGARGRAAMVGASGRAASQQQRQYHTRGGRGAQQRRG